MIQIQIATSLTEEGVGDVRWVLLEPGESPEIVVAEPADEPAPAPGALPNSAPAAAAGPQRSRPLWRWLAAAALVVSAAAAWWMALPPVDRGGSDSTGRTSMAAKK